MVLNNIKLNQVCLRTLKLDKPNSLSSYESIRGYNVLKKILLEKKDSKEIIDEIKSSKLKGRGGAAFLTGLKLSFFPKDNTGQKYIICNADEGEPGTFKDREILRFNPHQLIEGMLIIAYVLGASTGYNYIRGEYTEPFEIMEQAIKEAKQAGYLGQNILGTDFTFELHNVHGGGSYICGEETALLESLEGKKGLPRIKPPFPAMYGLYGKPTNVNNVETYASIPVILEKGSKWYLEQHYDKSKEGGYKIFCVSGSVNKPGVYEVPLGLPFNDLLNLAGGVKDNKKLKAIIPGGISSGVLPLNVISDLKMDYDSLAEKGSMLGTGAVIVLDEDANMVEILARKIKFFHEESCGQCTPCREGCRLLNQLMQQILQKKATLKEIDQLKFVAQNMQGNTICAFSDAVYFPVKSFLQYFKDEFIAYIDLKEKVKEKEQN